MSHGSRKRNKEIHSKGGYLIYKKDKCEECGSTDVIERDENGFMIRKKKVLTVHHIDHNHLNNEPSNLQTLCIKCHKNKHND